MKHHSISEHGKVISICVPFEISRTIRLPYWLAFVVFFTLAVQQSTWAQLSLTNAAPTGTINFSSSTPGGAGTNTGTVFTGAGFSPNPTNATPGRLNSNAWATTGWSDGALAFGGTATGTNYHSRGTVAAAITQGGIYAFTGSPANSTNPMLMIQPVGGDFAPGTLTLRIQNNGTTNISALAVSYDLFVRNDAARASSFNFSYSSDNSTYTAVSALDYTTPEAIGTTTMVLVGTSPSRSTTITGLNIIPGGFFYIRWSSADVSGSGSRDEIGLDNISITGTFVSNIVDAVITNSEYGTHTDGQNQQSNSPAVTYMSWDNTNLYVAITGANIAEGAVLYLDTDPQTPVNGGTNANGTITGNPYDNTNFAQLQFRANAVVYFKNGYREVRTSNGAGGWNSPNTTFGSYADNGGTSTREIAIPWSALGGIPASFNWFSYVASSGGFVYGEVPTENGSGFIGTSARFERYYTVTTTTVGSSTPPFSRNSYVFNSTTSNNAFGAINVWDFTMNTAGLQIARSNIGGNWMIQNNLVINDGTVFFGSGGSGYGTTSVFDIILSGGSLNMDQTNQPLNVTRSITMTGSSTFYLSGTIGGDLNLGKNFVTNGGTFFPNNRSVNMIGSTYGVNLVGGSTALTFDYLTINGLGMWGQGPITVNQNVNFITGRIRMDFTGTYILLAPACTVTGAGTSTYFESTAIGSSVRQELANGQTRTYHVGTASNYQPITLTNTGVTDIFTINVQAGPVAWGGATNTVSAYWNVQEGTAGGTELLVQNATYIAGQETAGFTAGVVPKIGMYHTDWVDVNATLAGSGPFTATALGTFVPSQFTNANYVLAIGKDAGFVGIPEITTSSTSLDFGYVPSGGTSAELSYTISALNLAPASGNVIISPPSNFEISLVSGGPYSSVPINLPYTLETITSVPVYVIFKPTSPNTSYSANATHIGGGASSNILLQGNSIPLPYATFDNFNRTDNATVGIPSSGGAQSWAETQSLGSTNRISVESNRLRLSSSSTPVAGGNNSTGYEYLSYDVSSKYSTLYGNVCSDLHWYFNMRSDRSSPSGFAATNYGSAVILGSDAGDFVTAGAGADGYAVIIGNTGSPDPVKLVQFTGGFNSNTNMVDVCASTETGETNYYSVHVIYNPNTGLWSLQVRNDGTTAFADPTAGVYGAAVTNTNTTHVGKDLKYFGALWNHQTPVSGSQNLYVDNISLPNALSTPTVYTWVGLTSDYTDPLNWNPARYCPATTDVLVFDATSPALIDVTNVPSESVAQLHVSGGRTVNLHDASSDVAASTLTLLGATGSDLTVEIGSALQLNVASSNNTADAMIINLSTGVTALIDGNFVFQNTNAGTAARPHQLTGTDAGSIVVNGSVFAFDLSGNPFGSTGTANVVLFNDGSTYFSLDGSNPFALTQPASKVVFSANSNYVHDQSTVPSLFGRTYGNFSYNFAGTILVDNGSSTGNWVVNNLYINSGTLTLSGATNVLPVNTNIAGNLDCTGGGVFNFTPVVASTIRFNGTVQQQLYTASAFNSNANATLEIANTGSPNSVQMNAPLTWSGPITLTIGTLDIYFETLTFTGSTINRDGIAQTGQITTSEPNGSLVFGNTSTLVIPNNACLSPIANVVISGSGGIFLAGNFSVAHSLTMISGTVTTGAFIFTLGTSASNPGVLSHSAGVVIGNFRRWMNDTVTYLFPVGTASEAYLAEVTFSNITPGTLNVRYIVGAAGTNGLPLTESGYTFANVYTEGYWQMIAQNGLVSTDYGVHLNATNYSSLGAINAESRVLKRADGFSNWTLDGVHVSAVSPLVYRNGLSGFGQFAISPATLCLSSVSAPTNGTQFVCDGTLPADLQVVPLNGTGPFTYQWYSNTTNSNSGGTSLGTANGADTDTYSPPYPLALGENYFYCVVTDLSSGCGSVASSVAVITFNSRPTATIGGSGVSCNGGGYTIDIAVTGSGIISGTLSPGSIPFSGTAPLISVLVNPSVSTVYTLESLSDQNCNAEPGDLGGSVDVNVFQSIPVTCDQFVALDFSAAENIIETSCGLTSDNEYALTFTASLSGVQNVEIETFSSSTYYVAYIDMTALGVSCLADAISPSYTCIGNATGNASFTMGNLIVGHEYAVVIESSNFNVDVLNVRVDCPFDCSTIQTVSCETPVNFAVVGTDDDVSFACGFTGYVEQLYSFTPTLTGEHNLVITNLDFGGGFPNIYFFDETLYPFECFSANNGLQNPELSSSLGYCLWVGGNNSNSMGILEAGHQYIIAIEGPPGFVSSGTFTIDCPFDCSTIQTVSCETPVNFAVGDTDDDVSFPCGFTGYVEQLYSFTPTLTGEHNLVITNLDFGGGFPNIYVFDETLYPFECITANDGLQNPEFSSSLGYCLWVGGNNSNSMGMLEAGHQYIIAIEGPPGFVSSGTFTIDCPFDCSTIQTVSCETPVNFAVSGTDDDVSFPCGFTGYVEQLYSFTPTLTGGHNLVITNFDFGGGFPNIYVFDETLYPFECIAANDGLQNPEFASSLGYCLFIGGNNSNSMGMLEAGHQYIIAIEGPPDFVSSGTFTIDCPFDCSTIPSLSCGVSQSASLIGSQDDISTSCTSSADELIYSFTASNPGEHSLTITASNGLMINYSIYDATTNGLCGTVLGSNPMFYSSTCVVAASSPGSHSLGNLISGNTYYIILEDALGTTATSEFYIQCSCPAQVIASMSPGSPVCEGSPVSFQAFPTNGGTPSYQWYVNGSPQGTNSDTFVSSSFADGDEVWVEMTSSLGCATPNPSVSPSLFVTVYDRPTAVLSGGSTICLGDDASLTVNLTGTVPWILGLSDGSSHTILSTPTTITVSPTINTTYTIVSLIDEWCVANPAELFGSASVVVQTPQSWYLDADADGYAAGVLVLACTAPGVGYVLSSALISTTVFDCQDTIADINPGMEEWCNGFDDDCDGFIDEGLPINFYYADADGDGFGNAASSIISCSVPFGYVTNSLDCNDANAAVYPGATEVCNGIDDDCDGTTDEGCGQINDEKFGALSLVPSNPGVCNAFSGNLAGAAASASGVNSVCVTGEDLWYYFTATSSAIRIECTSAANNILLELQDFNGNLVSIENIQSTVGNEILNVTGLTVGNTYYLGVRNFNSSQGIGAFTVCVQNILSSGCDYGPGPYSLCNVYKATFRAGASYRFDFVQTTAPFATFTRTQASDLLVLSNVPGLQYGYTYNVTITAIYSLTVGNGSLETLEVAPSGPCTMTVSPHPAAVLRVSDRCSNGPRFRGSFIQATPWVCGVTNWKWEFQELDNALLPVGLPITVYRGAASNVIGLASVTQLQYGKAYAVRTAPVFSYGDGTYGAAFNMCIIGTANAMLGSSSLAFEQTQEEGEEGQSFEVNVYPNPSVGDQVYIQSDLTSDERQIVKVLDATGKLIEAHSIVANASGILNVNFNQRLNNGIYFIEIISDGHRVVRKLIVHN